MTGLGALPESLPRGKPTLYDPAAFLPSSPCSEARATKRRKRPNKGAGPRLAAMSPKSFRISGNSLGRLGRPPTNSHAAVAAAAEGGSRSCGEAVAAEATNTGGHSTGSTSSAEHCATAGTTTGAVVVAPPPAGTTSARAAGAGEAEEGEETASSLSWKRSSISPSTSRMVASSVVAELRLQDMVANFQEAWASKGQATSGSSSPMVRGPAKAHCEASRSAAMLQ
mmetsp:Transcript_67952/g.221208  ORF Transcript_67952/g.221208 Transcript_67952/m.221208 type:complete len:225 (-) Transcript_67952:1045-1719(-)